jgi:hypothetical protein
MPEERKLNDADVEAIVSKMEERMTERFYGDIGRGVWAIVWKAVISALVLVAAYGSMKGFK